MAVAGRRRSLSALDVVVGMFNQIYVRRRTQDYVLKAFGRVNLVTGKAIHLFSCEFDYCAIHWSRRELTGS